MGLKTVTRLFVGVPLAEAVRQGLAGDITALAGAGHGGAIRWVPEANLHLTLKFLGEVDEGRVARLSRGLSGKLAAWPVMPAALLAGVVLFPGARRPRVVAAGVDGGDPLCHLAGRIELWAEKEGFPREKRKFSPHVTLGRVRTPRGPVPGLAQGRITPRAWAIDRVCLYESRLTPTGARYIVRHTVPLTKGAGLIMS